MLLENSDLRKQFGKLGQQKIAANYSIQSQASTFFNLFT